MSGELFLPKHPVAHCSPPTAACLHLLLVWTSSCAQGGGQLSAVLCSYLPGAHRLLGERLCGRTEPNWAAV